MYRDCVLQPRYFLQWVAIMNMHLYYAIGFSGIGVMLMLRYYNGADTMTMILGIICMVLGSVHGKKWQDGRGK